MAKKTKKDDPGSSVVTDSALKHLLSTRSPAQRKIWRELQGLDCNLDLAARLVLSDLAQMQADYTVALKTIGPGVDSYKYFSARRSAIELYRRIVQTAAETDNQAPTEITVHHVGLYTTIQVDPETGLPIPPTPEAP